MFHPQNHGDFKTQIEQFEALREYFIGFKLHATFHKYPIEGENNRYMLSNANEHKLPVLMHTWENNEYNGYDNCLAICERYRDFPFLMGHRGYGDYGRFAQLSRDYSNAFCELTATYALDGAIETMVKTAGSEKVIFGTDQPWFDPAYAAGCVKYSRISDREKENIFYNNAAGILDKIYPLR